MCDVADTCTGNSDVCPNNFAPSTTPCRNAVAGGCDVAELCTGNSATCPQDVVQPLGTPCRSSSGSCDIEERCDGVHNTCPLDAKQPDDHACSDSNVCTIGDVCRSGACVAGLPPLSGDPVDFGPGLVGGNPRTATLTLDWRDTGTVRVTALALSGSEFRIAAGQTFPIVLSPSTPTATVAMEFQPTMLGDRTATVTTSVDPPTCAVPVINLSGRGSPPGLAANPGGADFADVEIRTASPAKSFSVVNLSSQDAVIQSVTVSDSMIFALKADGLPATVPPDGSYTFTIVAKPDTIGHHESTVVITSSLAMLTNSISVDGVCTSAACLGGPSDPGDPGSPDGPNGETGNAGRASYYACSTGHPAALWPMLLVLVALLRPRRPR